MELEQILSKIKPVKEAAKTEAKQRWDSIAKPLESLGTLEQAVITLAGIKGDSKGLSADKSALIIMCADHGVVEEGVTQTGQEVTSIVARNFAAGKASVTAMAGIAGTDVFPVDIGMNTEEEAKEAKIRPNVLLNRKVERGSKNLAKGPAMTEQQCRKAIMEGILLVSELKNQGYEILATGEMGIGNTTPASALAAVLSGRPVSEVTGRGAGLSSAGLEKKILAVQRGIERYQSLPNHSPLLLLSELGGYDIAGMTGVFLGGAVYQLPVLIDGFISSVAAWMAVKIAPAAGAYQLPSHVSKEPAGKMVLDALGLRPFLTCDMCLGEGTGAVAAIPLLRMALAVYNQMSTFLDIEIEEYHKLS